ncbi:uncharacterized protein K489DRAFT_159283 [Dissoconium aciculare CBS 342.82]|uniref:Uncharacterized protein n=1 Tax=Dissoconium aciculare CBS 342.82 TaxID=1314786 RepID=A0A6J3MBU5_9PEZI|nr:uncharacterized protein K489DRAFT_159283 [Dissoconium aciculare CBS 342.82]KAF1825496.1 hypothetical protein K489DRAFT_159283 [Dissoconium aciculare CBS 342.82]
MYRSIRRKSRGCHYPHSPHRFELPTIVKGLSSPSQVLTSAQVGLAAAARQPERYQKLAVIDAIKAMYHLDWSACARRPFFACDMMYAPGLLRRASPVVSGSHVVANRTRRCFVGRMLSNVYSFVSCLSMKEWPCVADLDRHVFVVRAAEGNGRACVSQRMLLL